MGESASYKEDTVDKIQYMKEFGVNIFAIKSLRRVTLKVILALRGRSMKLTKG